MLLLIDKRARFNFRPVVRSGRITHGQLFATGHYGPASGDALSRLLAESGS